MERMKAVYEDSVKRGNNPPVTHFNFDKNLAAREKYAALERWEKTARSTAYAILNQDVIIEPYDKIIGRVYYANEKPVADPDPDFDFWRLTWEKANEQMPGYGAFRKYSLVLGGIPGHISWDWNYILKHGTVGIRERLENGLVRFEGDEKAKEFFKGALIMLDALDAWNERHVEVLEKMGKHDEAEICRRVPKYPARTFREAVQSFFMQHIVVMKEAPFGGNSPGRLDYYLWPFLERDLKEGVCTPCEAEELMEELFIRIDERIHTRDTWGESVVVGGSHPNRTSAVNPLSYIMIKAFMKHDITHPYLYARIPEDCPEDFLNLCAKYVKDGQNRAQIINDKSIMDALVNNGVSEGDAANYYCGGCMEVGIQGGTSDLIFSGWHNIPKILELCITGGRSLTDGEMQKRREFRSLCDFDSFEDFYRYFISECDYFMTLSLKFIDIMSESFEEARPLYLLSTMVDDCIARGRELHAGGARYHDYGASAIGIPNAADSLYAIRRAVFEDKICRADELIDALSKNFEGYELLRKRLLDLPKYGQEHEDADALAGRLSSDLVASYRKYVNRFGGTCKFILLSFIWSPEAGAMLGATPDGRLSGTPVAHSITPQSMAMTKGITAAINSCSTQPFHLFAGGASSMWDLDPSIANEEIIKGLFTTFFEQGGQMFQGNTTDVSELIRAQQHPDEYPHLIVRVGGFSARFVWLDKTLQDDIIGRYRHNM